MKDKMECEKFADGWRFVWILSKTPFFGVLSPLNDTKHLFCIIAIFEKGTKRYPLA